MHRGRGAAPATGGGPRAAAKKEFPIGTLSSILLEAFKSFWMTILSFMPNLLASMLILLVGLLLARLSKIIVERVLKFVKFGDMVAQTGLESLLSSSEYRITISSIVSGIVYWLIILLTVTEIAELLRLQIISDLFERIVVYLPNIMIALTILLLGTLFARIVNRYMFRLSQEAFGMDRALKAGIAVEYLVLVFVWFIALEQLKINTVLLLIVISTLFISLALALAISFGLAGRDHAARFLDSLVGKFRGQDEDGGQ